MTWSKATAPRAGCGQRTGFVRRGDVRAAGAAARRAARRRRRRAAGRHRLRSARRTRPRRAAGDDTKAAIVPPEMRPAATRRSPPRHMHQGDRAEQQPDHHRGHHRAQRDAALGRRRRCAHTASGNGRPRAAPGRTPGRSSSRRASRDACAPISAIRSWLRREMLRTRRPSHDDRQHRRSGCRSSSIGSELRREHEQKDDAADAGAACCAARPRRCVPTTCSIDRGVRREPRGDLRRPVLLEEAGRAAAAGCAAPRCGCRRQCARRATRRNRSGSRWPRQHQHDQQQNLEIEADPAGVGWLREALVDDQPEHHRDRQCRERSDDQRGRGDQEMDRIAPGEAPDDSQLAEPPLGGGGGAGGRGCGFRVGHGASGLARSGAWGHLRRRPVA